MNVNQELFFFTFNDRVRLHHNRLWCLVSFNNFSPFKGIAIDLGETVKEFPGRIDVARGFVDLYIVDSNSIIVGMDVRH